ncbi:MAG: hypothetical protein ACK4OE_04140 [Acidovorax sp.]|uniref:hypothetical protein n=1 Tax=Acidovorax sp. TaxID=1872122 RepID=UPI00391C3E89
MLNEISCWYMGWSAIGTWVGGIGAGAAAVAAVWTVRRQEAERSEFAKFLLSRDIGRLEEAHSSLLEMANALNASSFAHPDTGEEADWRDAFDEQRRVISVLLMNLSTSGAASRSSRTGLPVGLMPHYSRLSEVFGSNWSLFMLKGTLLTNMRQQPRPRKRQSA